MQPSKDIDPFNPGKWAGKPYNFFGDYLWAAHGCRVLKLPINAGLLCPNRTGEKGTGGCIFCSEDGSASPSATGSTSIRRQMVQARKSFKRSETETRYIAYFQAYTNTWAPPQRLKELYDASLEPDDVIGLMIGTRPDCLSTAVIELVSSYKTRTEELWVEIGMQTMHEQSLQFLNRGHTHGETRDAVKKLRDAGINVCLHLILGIPGETWDDMMKTAKEVASMDIQGVKFHHLHVIRSTPLEKIYKQGNISLLSMREYVSIVTDFIERLSPSVLIHRLSGDRDEASLVAPLWGHHKGTVLQAIENEFKRRGSFQGILFPHALQ